MSAQVITIFILVSSLLLPSYTVLGQESQVTPRYTLSEVLELSLERNPRVAGAEATIAEQKGERIAAGAYPNPSVEGLAGRGTPRRGTDRTPGSEYSIALRQPLEWPGKRSARIRAAEQAVVAARSGMDEALLDLRTETTIAFYQLLFANHEAKLASENLMSLQEMARAINRRVAAGEGARFG